MAQQKRNCLPGQETWAWSLGLEDTLEEEMVTYSSILAWEITRTEEPGGLRPWKPIWVGHELATKQQECIYLFFEKESGNSLRSSSGALSFTHKTSPPAQSFCAHFDAPH